MKKTESKWQKSGQKWSEKDLKTFRKWSDNVEKL